MHAFQQTLVENLSQVLNEHRCEYKQSLAPVLGEPSVCWEPRHIDS